MIAGSLEAVAGVLQVQLVQEELRRFRLLVVCQESAGWCDGETSLRASFAGSLGEDAALSIERVPAILPEAGGKVRASISRCHG